MKKLMLAVGIILLTTLAVADECPFLETHIHNKNELSVLGGYGAQKGFTGDLTGMNNSPTRRLTTGFKTGTVFGIQYQRSLTNKISVGVQGQTNDTVSLLFGVKF